MYMLARFLFISLVRVAALARIVPGKFNRLGSNLSD
jgi:hypothetical protein